MANINFPAGLQPVRRRDGARWGDSANLYYIPASYTQAVFVGDPVTKVAASANGNGINGVNLTAAGASNPITGVVVGFYGVLPSGAIGTPSFFPLSGTPGPAYRPASTSYDYYVLVNDDPTAEFQIQATSYYGGVVGTVLPVAAVGKNANFVGQISSATGTWTAGNTSFTISSAAGVLPGMNIVATSTVGGVPNAALGIPIGTTITAVSGTTVTISNAFTATQGSATDLLINGGNVFTGLSGVQLDSSAVATSATDQLSIIGFVQAANNAFPAQFAKVTVRINQHTEVPGATGI